MFLFENDDIRPDAPRGQASTITVVPKIDGTPVDASGASSGDWTVTESGGLALGAGTVSVTSVTAGSRTVASYVVPIPAIDRIQEDVVLSLRWTPTGGQQVTELVTFDVVAAALGGMVSVNDLLRHRPDVQEALERIGRRLGVSSSEQAAAEAGARSVAVLARQALQAMLRQRAETDGQPRPAQILDRRELARVEALLALRELYASLGRDPQEGEDQGSALYRHYRTQADSAFESMRVAYQTGEDLTKAGTTSFSRVFSMRRVQG